MSTTPVISESSGIEARAPLAAPLGQDVTEMVIRARKGWIPVDWAELIHFRELLYFLVWRDLKVRYKQTVLGVAWAVLQPLLSMVIFTVIFGRLAKIDSEGFPYAVFVYAGLLPWTFFSSAVALAGQSLINQQNLLTKIYFPRLFIPTASIGASLVDMGISFIVYAVVLAWYHVMPSWQIVFLPGLIALTVASVLGFGFILASLTVSYRDFRFVIPFMLQVMMYISPVVYPVSMIPPRYQWILALNPMAGIIDSYRSAILGKPWNLGTLGVSAAMSVGLFVFGLFYFRKTERRFADIA
jgi:lipopolysaccharide transport system permease protein